MASTTRSRVLGLYRQILLKGRTWKSGDAPEETRYILEEARNLFKKNKNLPADQIEEYIKEGESRMDLADHYGNPYPRMYYAQPGTIYKSGNRARKKIIPDYMQSYYDEDEFGLKSSSKK
mmetsp:Transcript_26102/g.62900  ORF Transcript_26102/g.62900 Transcript_26102/m.62900 type:complete len:120 (+) Transcript_26102:186-545(+)